MPTWLSDAWHQFLVLPLELGLQYLSGIVGPGMAIILFTVISRTVLLPLTIQQLRSTRAMAAVQPELKALQAKYASNKEKLGTETMALYKERGINPAAGCFPLLLQMPILFGLYGALSDLAATDQDFQQQWLWLEGLHKPDVISVFGISLPFIFPVLAALTQWVQQRMMTQPSTDPNQQMQNQMMQFMPLMMLWIGTTVSSGLGVYWVAQNVYGIVQQYFMTGWGSLATVRIPFLGGSSSGEPAEGSTGSGSTKVGTRNARAGNSGVGGGRRANGKS